MIQLKKIESYTGWDKKLQIVAEQRKETEVRMFQLHRSSCYLLLNDTKNYLKHFFFEWFIVLQWEWKACIRKSVVLIFDIWFTLNNCCSFWCKCNNQTSSCVKCNFSICVLPFEHCFVVMKKMLKSMKQSSLVGQNFEAITHLLI